MKNILNCETWTKFCRRKGLQPGNYKKVLARRGIALPKPEFNRLQNGHYRDFYRREELEAFMKNAIDQAQ